MKQVHLNASLRARLVAERIDRSLINGASFPVIDGGPHEEPDRRCAHERWGRARTLADALLYRLCGRGLRDPLIDRLRD